MSYLLEIRDNTLYIQGLFGRYEARSSGTGFDVAVIRAECAPELDENGEEYLIDAGQEWRVPAGNLSELDSFIRQCEEERLWNYMPGPVFRARADQENSVLFLKGVSRNFFLGADSKGLYIDDSQTAKTHHNVKNLMEATHFITREDRWWMRPAAETLEILRMSRSSAAVTDGGRLQIVCRDKNYRIGQKEDLSFWVNVSADQERHIYYKDSWKEVLGLMA